MTELSGEKLDTAREIMSRYPRRKSALIPLLHLAQEVDGYVTNEAMEIIAELVECTPAEVIGTASFYEMFKFHPTGDYLINICTNISCLLLGGEELFEHAERTLDVRSGGTTSDGKFTLEDVECIAACTEAPCFQVNYRYVHRADAETLDEVVADLRAGKRPAALVPDGHDDIATHGTLARTRQHIDDERRAGIVAPEEANSAPHWLEN
jgi:NADH-quinone oxidoreductase subunit E